MLSGYYDYWGFSRIYDMEELSECEKKVLEMLAKLQPYGKLEIAKNQDGNQLSIYLTNPEKCVIKIEE